MTIAGQLAPVERWIAQSRVIVAFTGAGVSTDSGIPDFRSPGGLWSRYQPIDFADFLSSESARRESWRRKFAMRQVLDDAKPNRGHHALARAVQQDRVASIITQNVDGLHQAAGVPNDRVIELHGNTTYATCLECGARYDLDSIRRAFERDETAPACSRCGGWIKTATISFGQPMPHHEMHRAEVATLDCDLFLAIGSSLVVYPAAGLPALAKRSGARLVILNREPTAMDPLADHVVHAEISPTLEVLFPAVNAARKYPP